MIVPHTVANLRVSSPQLAHPHSVVCVIKSQMSFNLISSDDTINYTLQYRLDRLLNVTH